MVEVVREGEQAVLIDPQTGSERRLLAPAFVQHGIEILRYTIPAGSSTGTFPASTGRVRARDRHDGFPGMLPGREEY
jgi:hypothetical protein